MALRSVRGASRLVPRFLSEEGLRPSACRFGREPAVLQVRSVEGSRVKLLEPGHSWPARFAPMALELEWPAPVGLGLERILLIDWFLA